jgi:hypothetical protein
MWKLQLYWKHVLCSPQQLQRPLVRAPPGDKSIKIQIPGILASETAKLSSREHRNCESTSRPSSKHRQPTPPVTTSAHQATQPQQEFASQLASPPLTPASPLLQELCPASRRLATTGLLLGRTPSLAGYEWSFRRYSSGTLSFPDRL